MNEQLPLTLAASTIGVLSTIFLCHRKCTEFDRDDHSAIGFVLGFQRILGPFISRSTSTIRNRRAATSSCLCSSSVGSLSVNYHTRKSSSMAWHLAIFRCCRASACWASFLVRVRCARRINHTKSNASTPRNKLFAISYLHYVDR